MISPPLNLRIVSPSKIIVEEKVKKISLEDKSGALTILPRHQDYVSSFGMHLLSYINVEDKQFFVIVNEGILVKVGKNVDLSVYSAVTADSLEELKAKVGGLSKRELNIQTDKEKQVDESLKELSECFFKKKL